MLIGLLVIVLFFRSAKAQDDRAFRWMWLTIVLSFGFYIPVVLWADVVPMIGMLMIPKTCAYVWTVLIGYKAMKTIAAAQTERRREKYVPRARVTLRGTGVFYVAGS